ncbi:MAG: heparinase, partial [Arenibacterium sp.]
MSSPHSYSARWTRLMNQFYARLSRRQPSARGFVSQPEPRTVGSFARGRQLVAGNILFSGYLVESKDTGLWEVQAPDVAF